ncbi:MAG: sugar phosphate nucleotidyltransferase, partial [Thermoactinomyces sp.]
MKGLILCAGNATRIQPFSFSIPKALLPVANQTVLDRCIRKLAEAGINDIGIVINPQQNQFERHLSTYVNQLKITIIYQTEQLGIAHALICAKSFIGQEPFVLLLGDNLILEQIQTLLDAFQNNMCAIMLASVENPSDYGIADLRGERIIGLEEKPRKPKSPYAVIGAYAFQPAIFEAAANITRSARGEYEITDAIDWLIQRGNLVAYSITDKLFYDIGT